MVSDQSSILLQTFSENLWNTLQNCATELWVPGKPLPLFVEGWVATTGTNPPASLDGMSTSFPLASHCLGLMQRPLQRQMPHKMMFLLLKICLYLPSWLLDQWLGSGLSMDQMGEILSLFCRKQLMSPEFFRTWLVYISKNQEVCMIWILRGLDGGWV